MPGRSEGAGGFCPPNPSLRPSIPSPQCHCPAPPPSQRGGQGWGARWASYEDLGQGVGTRAGDEGLAGVAGNRVDGLLMLLAVGRDLLNTRLVVQAPQTQRAVMACAGAGAGEAVAQQLQVPQLPAQNRLLNPAVLETAEPSWPPSMACAFVRALVC